MGMHATVYQIYKLGLYLESVGRAMPAIVLNLFLQKAQFEIRDSLVGTAHPYFWSIQNFNTNHEVHLR